MSRKILISMDDSDGCEEAVKWTLQNIYKPAPPHSVTDVGLVGVSVSAGDEVHLIHVIPRLQLVSSYNAPPIDFLPYSDQSSYQKLIDEAEAFLQRRALVHMTHILEPHLVVHIIKYEIDSDSVGNVICKKAEELDAAVTVMSRHNKSKLQEFFLGSVTNFCLHHCKKPVLVYNGS